MEIAKKALVIASLLAVGCSANGNQGDSAGVVPGAIANGDGTFTNPDGTIVDADGTPVMNPDGTPLMATGGGAGVGVAGTGGTGGTGAVVGAGGTTATGGSTGSGGSGPLDVCAPGIASTSQVGRITNEQYDRTVRDLLGVTGLTASNGDAPSTLLATEQSAGLSELGWSAYKSVGGMIAAQVMADSALSGNYIACDPAAANCLQDTIVEFGARAFRRPLTDTEIASFARLIERGATITENGTPEEIAEAILYVFLVSPSFIQRSEITEAADAGGNYVLSSYEVASRLSYMLWGTMPDAALSTAAASGLLTTPEQILAEAQRMLQDPKAHDMVAAFHRSYLLLGTNTRWDSADRDPATFPDFDRASIPAMAEETEMFFDHIVFALSGQFSDFFLSPVAFVNNETAGMYGLNPADHSEALIEVALDSTVRPGFLTRVGFLNAYSSYARTSPILRGAFITKEVLGIKPGAPPPGAAQEPLPESADLDTNRKQVVAQTSGASCVNCHQTYINPPGFVMEAFNAVGEAQIAELGTGVEIDTVADVHIDGAAVTVSSPAELMGKIAASPAAQRYYAQSWVGYAYDRGVNPQDTCTVDTLGTKMTAGGYTVLNLITDLTQTESFRTRSVEVAQ